MTNIFAVRLNPDIRKCTPYSKYPTEEEYSEVHNHGVMNGFHEAVNFLSEDGKVRGYLPPSPRRAMRTKEPFTLISVTAVDERREGIDNMIVGIQAGCIYLGNQDGRGLLRKNKAGLDLTWHYQCDESLSLLLPKKSLPNAIELIRGNDKWGQNPTFPIDNKKTFDNIVAKVREVLTKKEDIDKLERIVKFTKGSITQSEFDAQVAAALASDDLDNVIGNENPERVPVSSSQYQRDPKVVAWALREANGICQDCKKKAPFLKRETQQPYLEVHHKIPLAEGGSDTTDNVIALCPNCHRKRHFG